jgi:mono/diheme cytochrome c family protein
VRLILCVLLALGACKSEKKQGAVKSDPQTPPPGVGPPDATPPEPVEPAPPLTPVEGDPTAAKGEPLFKAQCASCHGADGRGRTARADEFPRAPTDLTTTSYLCRTTMSRGESPVPSDRDVESALERGVHRTLGFEKLAPAERRSLTLYVKTLATNFAGDPPPLFVIPPEPADDAASRDRGKMLFYGWGCWYCHGPGGKGDGDAAALKSLRWNGRPVKVGSLQDENAFLCGGDPESVYRAIALGRGGRGEQPMPPYAGTAEWSWKDSRPPEEWGKGLEGKISAEELAAWRAFWAQLPVEADVRAMKEADRKARAAGMLWDLVHYVRSL